MTYRSKIIKIDSSNVSFYNNNYLTSFLTHFENIDCENNESIIYSLQSVQIPYSFYSVNQYNSYMDICETINATTSYRCINIPHGNYNVYEYANMLKSLMNNTHITYTITYIKPQNKYMISCDEAAIFLYESGVNSHRSNYKFLGLIDSDIHINNTPQYSQCCITMNDIYYLQLKSDLGSNYISNDETENILEIIPISPAPYAFIQHTPTNDNKFLLTTKYLNTISISLTDNHGRALDLNNLPFYITIKIDILNNDTSGIPYATDLREMGDVNSDVKTNLEYITENPSIVSKSSSQAPLNLTDLIEYNNIQKMILKEKYKKTKK